MNEIEQIIEALKDSSEHEFLPIESEINKDKLELLPKDLQFFYTHFTNATLNKGKFTEIKIVGLKDLTPINKFLYPPDDDIWEELAGDMSNEWFLLATSESLSQYISIDLRKDKLGYCYDSFLQTHANPGDSLIIAQSFTELLINLSKNQNEWYWLNDNFCGYGDAYQ